MTWWIWVVGGLVLGLLELLLPAFIFLGFAIGAIVTGILVWLEIGMGTDATSLLMRQVLIFAVLSLCGWLGLRMIFGNPNSDTKRWRRDINDL